MHLSSQCSRRLGLGAGLMLALGCRTAPPVAETNAPPVSTPLVRRIDPPSVQHPEPHETATEALAAPAPTTGARIFQAAHIEEEPAAAPPVGVDAQPLADELSVELYVAEVLQRNPTLTAAAAAWQAASQRYPQVIALDDPMLQTAFGPAAWGNDGLDGGYMVGVSQKVPWNGKRELKGQMALWDANAAKWDSVDVRVQLTEAARLAYYEYFLVERQLEVNRANLAIMQEFRDIAQARYEVNASPQQDVLQANVELGSLERRGLELQQRHQTAVARINTLLHRSPLAPVPPAPDDLAIETEPVLDDSLLTVAIQQRPDLAALASRIESERAAVALACREYYPDLEFMARYDAFWQEKPLRPMVGVNLNIPLNHERRHAAVNEAGYNLLRLQAEYARQSDSVMNSVKAAQARLEESRSAIDLYRDQIIPAAEANVAAARAGYEAGQVSFLNLVEAQRQLNDLQEQLYETIAEYHSRQAQLEREMGGSLSN